MNIDTELKRGLTTQWTPNEAINSQSVSHWLERKLQAKFKRVKCVMVYEKENINVNENRNFIIKIINKNVLNFQLPLASRVHMLLVNLSATLVFPAIFSLLSNFQCIWQLLSFGVSIVTVMLLPRVKQLKSVDYSLCREHICPIF